MSILDQIIAAKRLEVAAAKRKQDEVLERFAKEGVCERGPRRSLKAALGSEGSRPQAPRIIAEIKKASPSAGLLSCDFVPVALAAEYQSGGAAALSVVTERNFFQGSLTWLREIRSQVALPLLRKDFIIDSWQIEESLVAGADAILLLAAVLETGELARFLARAEELDLECLVEIRDLDDAAKVAAVNAPLVGINNRDLRDFSIDLETSLRLAARLPQDRLVVSESGIEKPADIRRLQAGGINAFLIGGSLVRAGADRLRLLTELQT
ncbi:MAG TPA: indole-3-glycerol phosphate synthase TrpC [Proteobacteria bacterium]|nr:indole-3-glycerol phosphate synthase TrpC [Pseudomonadota bacterium]